ncbi:MAG: VWA domain-containing protein [Deltaproteobacteria bacterium]|nr:VWA domain-containing protein [Deltaproteobacteria bacterium]
MKDFLSHLYFNQPSYLPLLLLLPLLWLRLRGRSLAVILWRSVVFLLLVLALADPLQVGEQGRAGERIFAFDLSRSIPEQMRNWMAKQGLPPQPGDRTFVFAGEPKEVANWDRWVRGEMSAAAIEPGQTNLEALFSALLSLPPAPRSLLLFTDGWETQGNVERLLPSLALSGLKVFPLLPPDRPVVANVAVKRVVAPHQGTSGEGISLKVMVENQNSEAVAGNLVLRRDGQPLRSETVKIDPGTHIFTYQTALPDVPMVSFQANFTPRNPESDRFSQDNQATAWVAVRTKAKVLLLNGHSGEGRYLEEILKRRGFEVTSPAPGFTPPAPTGYQAVVFNNVERERFSAGYLAGIERHVAEGNGFLMLGAEGSFAPGGYQKTPIESLLPVELREPAKEEKNRAVILVIDKSGSMREEGRLLYAKEAAKTVAGQLKDNDFLGVLGFDVEPFVVVPLSAMEKIRGTVSAQIDRLKAQGKTYLYPAIVEAKRQLERQKAGRKHVIILSDGETGGSGSDYIDLVSGMKDGLKITVSTVAIGDQPNIPLLKRIAQYGGGFFHHTYDPTTLPQIVLQQIKEKPAEEPLAEKDFTALPVKGSELLAGFAERSYPPLKGFIKTEIKRGARVDLVIPQEENSSPLLASWNYGKGKAVAFTTDLHGRWSKEWIGWGALERFWGQVFDWLRPPGEPLPPHEVRINLTDGQVVLDLYLYAEGRDAALFRYSLSGKGASGEGVLNRLAPGHYQTALPIAAPGDYRIGLIEEFRGQRLSYPTVGYTLSFDPKAEMIRHEFNTPLLEKLARSTGGEINPKKDESLKVEEKITPTFKPLRSHLLLAALVVFLAEIIFRRFLLPATI